MKALFAIGVFALAAVLMAEEIKLGTGVTLKEATPIAALTEKPAEYLGKTVRIDGVATAVCQSMGCWMAVAADGSKDAKTVRLKVEDLRDCVSGLRQGQGGASAEGVFEEDRCERRAREGSGRRTRQTRRRRVEDIR